MLKKIITLTFCLSSFILSNTAFSQALNTVYSFDCQGGPDVNGIFTSQDNASANNNGKRTGHSAATRRGNNGKGNGGEAWDVFITIDSSANIQYIHYVCLDLASEDGPNGTLHVDVNGDGNYEIVRPLGIGEFDPGNS